MQWVAIWQRRGREEGDASIRCSEQEGGRDQFLQLHFQAKLHGKQCLPNEFKKHGSRDVAKLCFSSQLYTEKGRERRNFLFRKVFYGVIVGYFRFFCLFLYA